MQGIIPENIPPSSWLDALNYEFDSNNQLSPRRGFSLVHANATPDAKQIQTIFQADFASGKRTLVATESHVYEFAAGTWTTVYTVSSTGNRFTFAMLNANTSPVVVFGNGKDSLQKWDGTTCSSISAAPKGRPIAFKNYLAVFDIDGSPNKVQFSIYSGDPDTWDIGGVKRFIQARGRVTGLHYSQAGLLIFSDNQTEIFYGDPGQTQGAAVLSTTVGCVVHETIANCGGAVLWLSQSGVLAWTCGGEFPSGLISNPPGGSSIQRDIERIAIDVPKNITGCYDPWTKRYFLSAQLRKVAAGDLYWRTLVFDFTNKAWFPWDSALTAMFPVTGSDSKQVLTGGLADGALVQYGSATFTDATKTSSTTYSYWIMSGDYDFENPNTDKIIRGLHLGTTGSVQDLAGGVKTLSITIYGEFGRIAQANITIDASTGGFVMGVGRIGVDKVYDRPGYDNVDPGILDEGLVYLEPRVPIAMRSKHFRFKISGSGTANAVGIGSIGIDFRPGVKRPILVKR